MGKKRYLQQVGFSWYLRVKVPPALQAKVGNTHVRRALGTRDLDEANRRKWPALALVRTYFDTLAQDQPAQLPCIAAASTGTALPSRVATTVDHRLRSNDGMDTLAEQWAMTSPSKTVQFQRRQTYRELRTYLRGNWLPEQVTDGIAAAYVDEALVKSPDSPSTRRRKLSALRAFWEWLATRRYVPRDRNPWKGFRLHDREGSSPNKRPYTMTELVTLFSGNPTYPALREVMTLGLYTGARIDELCSLLQGDIRIDRGVAYVRINKSKTKAGVRTIAIAHPTPFGVVKSRYRKTATAKSQLFPELKGGGYDQKLSWHVGQAFRYHRNGRGLTGATDFHSLRRTFVTRLENLGVDQVRIARYIGHSLPTLAFQLYSGGATEVTQRATGRAISYPRAVELAVKRFLS